MKNELDYKKKLLNSVKGHKILRSFYLEESMIKKIDKLSKQYKVSKTAIVEFCVNEMYDKITEKGSV